MIPLRRFWENEHSFEGKIAKIYPNFSQNY